MNLGEIRYGKDIGKADGDHKFIWDACEICRCARWVRLVGDKPISRHCRLCENKVIMSRRGVLHPNWNGGETMQKGYVVVYKPEHPNHDINGYVKRCRLALEFNLGEILPRDIDIHHINGIKTDDRPENLVALSHSEHLRLHGLRRGRLQKEKCNA